MRKKTFSGNFADAASIFSHDRARAEDLLFCLGTHVWFACHLKEIKTIVMWDIPIEIGGCLCKNILIINFGDKFNIAVIGNMKHYLNRNGKKKAKTCVKTFYTIIHTKPFQQNLFQQLLSTPTTHPLLYSSVFS